MRSHVVFVTFIILLQEICGEDAIKNVERDKRDDGQTSSNADVMVQNILQWLQGVYTQNSRKIRQGSFREYLPPSNTQKPRPFEPQPSNGNGNYFPPDKAPYPPSGSITPQPPFTIYTNPATGAVTGEGGYPSSTETPGRPTARPRPTSGYSTRPTTIFTSSYPTTNGYQTRPRPTGYPTRPTGYPTRPTGYPTRPTGGYPTGPTGGYPTRPTGGYPTGPTGGYPTRPTGGYPTGPTGGYPTRPTGGYPTGPTGGYPSRPTGGYPTGPTGGYPTRPTGGYPTGPSYTTKPTGGYPTRPTGGPSYTTKPTGGYPTRGPDTERPTGFPTGRPTSGYRPSTEVTTTSTYRPGGVSTDENVIIPDGTSIVPTEDDLRHPPHIHDIQVQCAKDMMQITIEFNRQFDGVIYSKGYYNQPECRYVAENSGQIKYTFTVSLNSCGTEFINGFDTLGQSYLENVLVIQNEPGVQEVWDTIRAVRCLWEGNLKETLSATFNVGMLAQEIVTFSGDTAMAKLDIQMGRGPFAQPVNGLVKIGELMTLVVSVTGDPGFDIQVKQCRAKDTTSENTILLTDEDGCVLKPKLFGAFQKTRETGNTGASIIAFAFFNAFKFPDIMDLILECDIELCKTDCEVCPNPDQPLEPGRRRRRRSVFGNDTILGEPVTMGRKLSILLPEDLSQGEALINLNEIQDNICMSMNSFIISTSILVILLVTSSMITAVMWVKNQRLHMKV